MNILVVGSGGREHAVIRKLKRKPGNRNDHLRTGQRRYLRRCRMRDIKATDIEGMKAFALEKEPVDFCIVTPDDPLALGMVDALEEAGIPCFGPRANAAIIEASKAFSKELMKKYGIPDSCL